MNIRIHLAIALALAASPLLVHAQAAKPAAQPAKPAAQQPQPQQADPDAAFDVWDKNKDNQISREEFRDGWAMARNDLIVQRLAAEFQRQDANKNSKIEASEYGNLMLVKRLGGSAPPLATFDKNKDAGLDFNEYLEFVKTAARNAAPQSK